MTRASGYGERAAAWEMLVHVTPQVTQNTANRSSAIDRRTTRHPGYGVSQWRHKRVEEIFGWLKTVGLLRKARRRGRRASERAVHL